MSFDTIRKCIDNHFTIRVVCEGRNCTNDQPVDLVKLGQKLGFDHSTMHDDLTPKFRCTRCGSRNVSLRFSPDHKRSIEEAQQQRYEESMRGRGGHERI